ncbi:MAG: hypothetical protein HY059_17300 [Proteobacteria bacterium]|nr:hypothetical protein [Pseudomonadota bacterium]
MTSAIGTGSTLTQWYTLSRTSEDSRVDRFSKNNSEIKSATANFESAVDRLKSTDDLFSPQNYKLLKYVLTAYGLESEIPENSNRRSIRI